MRSIFELGNWDINTEIVLGSKVIVIDNFYRTPKLIKDFILKPMPNLWRAGFPGSRNGCDYQDRRSIVSLSDKSFEDHKKTFDIISQLIGQPAGEHSNNHSFTSNVSKFHKTKFNNYHDNWWWPHRDRGYNAIVYLNDEFGDSEYTGTALFHPDGLQAKTNEGVDPWIPKFEYELVKHMKGKYNRCVLFDGKLFPHAMLIDNDDWFQDFYRVNTVLFFDEV